MNFLKFTGDGRGIIGFCLCHLIFLFDNAPIKVAFRFGGMACAKQVCVAQAPLLPNSADFSISGPKDL